MLSGADLDKIFDEGFGDAGFNDPIPDVDAPANTTKQKPQTLGKTSPAEAPKPYARPAVSGATPPPPAGVDLEKYELNMALDEAARKKGYKSVEEYNEYLEKSGAGKTKKEEASSEMEEMPLAPGIKKAPAYMPPGAYPGDRTKVGKAYDKEQQQQQAVRPSPSPSPCRALEAPQVTFVKQSDRHDLKRAQDGHSISFRLDGSSEDRRAEVGGTELPWALDDVVRRMKVGDVVDVVATGEHAFADSEAFQRDCERRWRFELVSIDGRARDKFGMDHEQRIALAEQLRLRGNDLFKQQRLHRALHYYERGSALMDVLEAEELGMPGGVSGPQSKEAAERNSQIWQCQKPLLLNWALILMKLEQWQEAERKCTEVLMDIDKLNVKALFRRGQCNIHLGNHEQAQSDLSRAAELDTSIAKEVEREMVKVREIQRVADEGDRGVATRAVKGYFEAGDVRSTAPAPVEPAPGPDPTQRLVNLLESQEEAAKRSNADDDTYCRQREAIYNHFLAGAMQPRVAVDD